jgi:hypothetical protein
MNECVESYESQGWGFDKMCEAEDIGLETYLKCLTAEPYKCENAVYFDGLWYCSSPTLVHIAKKKKK